MENNIYRKNPENNLLIDKEIDNFWKHFDSDATVTYSLYFPIDGNTPGVIYAPHGVFQIIDYAAAYNGKILSGEYLTGKVLDADEIRTLSTEEDKFVTISLNLNGKHSDLLVEGDKWLYSIAEERKFYIFLRCIANISTGQIANLYFWSDIYKDKIKQGAISEENYRLLKGTLLYGAYKDYE